MNKLYLLLFTVFFILISCEEKNSNLGLDVLPESDLLSTYKDSFFLQGFNDNTFRINAKNPTFAFLGQLNDETFGKTTAQLLLQFYPYKSPWTASHGHNIVDSAFIVLPIYTYFGDTNSILRITVNLINKDISSNLQYYTNLDANSYTSQTSVEIGNVKRYYKEDSVKVPIVTKFGQMVMDNVNVLDSTFVRVFKGFVLNASNLRGKGALLKLNALDSAQFRVYYHIDTVPDTSIVAHEANFVLSLSQKNDNDQLRYMLTSVNPIKHDVSSTTFQNSYDDNADSTIFIQGLGGTNGLVRLPPLEDLKKIYDKDTFIVQRAYIELPLAPNFSPDTAKLNNSYYTLAQKLFVATKNSKGFFSLISDYQLNLGTDVDGYDDGYSDKLVDGGLKKSTLMYNVNITRYMQEYVSGKRSNNLYLFLESSNSASYWVALDPATEKSAFEMKATMIDASKIKLRIKYSKY